MRTQHEQHLGEVQYIKIWQRKRECLSCMLWKDLSNGLFSEQTGQQFYQFWGSWGQRVWVCVAQSEVTPKEDINWQSSGVEMTSGWIINRVAGRRVFVCVCASGVGVSDEVMASVLKLCQEVCVWANELGEEALSQEAWPREGPVVLASPPHKHVTTLHTPPLCWSHNTLFPGQCCTCMYTTWAHTLACCACVHQQTRGCDAKSLWHNKVWRVVQTEIFGKFKQQCQVERKSN